MPSPQVLYSVVHQLITVAGVLRRGFVLNAEVMPSEGPMDKVDVPCNLRRVRMVIAKVTSRCNLRCAYCCTDAAALSSVTRPP